MQEEQPKSLEYHVQELRSRVLHSVIVLTILSAIGLYFSADILSWIQADLGFKLNALSAYETIYTQILIGLLFGFFTALPAILYQLLKFAKPGLKPKEYRIMRNYLPFSFILFVGGSVFAYNFIVKTSLDFFRSATAAADVGAVWSLQNTIGFAVKLSAVTGVMFQLPIVSMILAKAGIISSTMMRTYRTYFFVGILIVSAIATPPDIVSQLLVTVPVMGLYQLSIFLVGRVETV